MSKGAETNELSALVTDEREEVEEVSFAMVLKNRDFVKLLSGQIFSNIGDAMLRASILLYVYSITLSESTTTLVLSVQIIPWIIVGPIAGVFADRISRKFIMVNADITRAIALVFIPFTRDVFTIAIITFIVGIASASFTAPRSAAIPEITGMRLFVKAISLSQLLFQTIGVVGPLAAAYIFSAFGPTTFWIASGGFSLSAIIIFLTNIPDAQRSEERMTVGIIFSDLKEGVVFLFNNPVTKNILILFTVIIFGGAYAGPLILPYIFRILHNSNIAEETVAQQEYGIIGSLTALGSIMGNLFFGKFERRIGRVFPIVSASLVFGLYFLNFMFYPNLVQLAILTIFFGFFNGMMNLAINAVFAEAVPNEIRGRAYSATNAYLQIFTALFTGLSGVTASIFGLVNTFVGVSVIFISFVILFSLVTRYRFLRI